ncbi:MAG: hypothetical protein ACLGXA_21485 [Acidobacteriota bacterium]
MVVFVRIVAGMAVVAAAWPVWAQNRYPKMAPVEQYLMADRNAEIALARSAAPESISAHAEVMVLGRDGYEVAVPGTNHFVCFVERGWDAGIGDPGFWNPKTRGPNCLNEAAARSWLPIALMKTSLALSGKSETEIDEAMRRALSAKTLPPLEPGAVSYMLSKEGYLNDAARNWHPHIMFLVPLAMSKSWGANLEGSPVLASDDVSDGVTVFMIPVARWSDGTIDANAGK